MGCERLRPSELSKLQNKTIQGFLQLYEVMVCDILVEGMTQPQPSINFRGMCHGALTTMTSRLENAKHECTGTT